MSAVHVDIATRDGAADAYLVHPDGAGPFPAVLLYMDAFGLRPHLKKMADRLASAGYTVLVPNVFYRHGRAPVIDLPDFVGPAERPEIFQRIGPLIQSLTPESTMADADAYLRGLAECPMARSGPVGVTGYCMGAGLALRTAGTYPDRVAAAAGFHGANLASTAPDSPHLLADRIKGELYFGHADQDHALPPSRSSVWTRRSPRPVYSTAAWCTPAHTTASPRRTPPPTITTPRNATGRHCWTFLGVHSDALKRCRRPGNRSGTHRRNSGEQFHSTQNCIPVGSPGRSRSLLRLVVSIILSFAEAQCAPSYETNCTGSTFVWDAYCHRRRRSCRVDTGPLPAPARPGRGRLRA